MTLFRLFSLFILLSLVARVSIKEVAKRVVVATVGLDVKISLIISMVASRV